ncbi:hypothetical protein GMJAKD_17580 [Candidatus Electrothrix aarhusensis]
MLPDILFCVLQGIADQDKKKILTFRAEQLHCLKDMLNPLSGQQRSGIENDLLILRNHILKAFFLNNLMGRYLEKNIRNNILKQQDLFRGDFKFFFQDLTALMGRTEEEIRHSADEAFNGPKKAQEKRKRQDQRPYRQQAPRKDCPAYPLAPASFAKTGKF